MTSGREFRALSLDLGETVWWDTPRHGARQDEARDRILSAVLVGPDGDLVEPRIIASERTALRADLALSHRSTRAISTAHRIEELARRLGARLTIPLDHAVERFAFAGLDTDPPTVNPEAHDLVRTLNRTGVPVGAISNTQRTGEAWRGFLRAAGMRFDFVITSSDLELPKPNPGLFHFAAHLFGLPPGEILHVGDRWETDIVGALSVGMGAGLYRGLWSRYWDTEEGAPSDPGTHPEVPRWDHLTEARSYFSALRQDPS